MSKPPLPPLSAMPAPGLSPVPAETPPTPLVAAMLLPSALLPAINQAYAMCMNPQDREKFAQLRNVLRSGDITPLPSMRGDGRSSGSSRLSIIYAAIVHTLRLMARSAPVGEVQAAVDFILKATKTEAWTVGDPGKGYTLVFTKPEGR